MAACKHRQGRQAKGSERYVHLLPRHKAKLTPEDAAVWCASNPMAWQRLEQLAKAEGIVNVRHVLALLRSTRHCPADFKAAAQLARLLANMLAGAPEAN